MGKGEDTREGRGGEGVLEVNVKMLGVRGGCRNREVHSPACTGYKGPGLLKIALMG